METVLTCAVFGVFIMSSFSIGYRYGAKKENILKQNISNPIKERIKNKKIERKQEEQEEELFMAINNIEKYNGSSEGQEVIR